MLTPAELDSLAKALSDRISKLRSHAVSYEAMGYGSRAEEVTMEAENLIGLRAAVKAERDDLLRKAHRVAQ